MSAKLFDSHAHYDDEKFDIDRDQLLGSLGENHIDKLINVACDMPSCQTTIALSQKYPFVYGAVGVHPHAASEVVQSDYLSQLSDYAKNEKVVAIGEIGLDYHYDFSPQEAQKLVFAQQMQLAAQLDMPVIIHSREATADTLQILQQFPQVTGVVHCFSGSDQTATKLLAMGYYIGFTGSLTFKGNKKGVAAADVVPLDKLLIETDCPYMAPVPLRGQRCNSTMLPYTAMKLAEIKGVGLDDLINITHQNTCKLFSITD